MSSQLQLTSLPLWTEMVGILCELASDESCIYVKIGNKTLCLPKESVESEIALDKLHQDLIGQKIGLLRTDKPMKPLVVRLIDK